MVGYLLTGILAGPYVLNLAVPTDLLDVLSKLGITALLFIVGLNLRPQVSREVGKGALLLGVGQITLTFILGYGLLRLLGMDFLNSSYLALALTFSSTIIVLKLLADRGDLEKLSGRLTTGVLLIQDLVAAAALLVIPALTQTQVGEIRPVLLQTLGTGVLAAVGAYIVSQVLLVKISKFAARSTELLFLFAIAWGIGLAAVFKYLGFSLEIGALLAGVTLSTTPYSQEISSHIKPIRDLFIILFFILLGFQFRWAGGPNFWQLIIIISLFVIVVKPLLIFLLMNLLGYTRRTGFKVGVALSQVSEFSLILIALGVQAGYLAPPITTLITLIGILTITVSTYLVEYEDKVYSIMEGFLRRLEWRKSIAGKRELQEEYDTILFGFHRVGQDFIEAFKDLNRHFIIVDFDPNAVEILKKSGLKYRYGDASDIEFLNELNLRNVNLIVSTVPELETNILLTRQAKKANPQAVVIAVSHNVKESQELYQAGATYVVMPHYLGAQTAAKMIVEHEADLEKYTPLRQKHLKYLEKRTV